MAEEAQIGVEIVEPSDSAAASVRSTSQLDMLPNFARLVCEIETKPMRNTSSAADEEHFMGMCPRYTLCALNWYELVLLTLSRLSVYTVYPLMMALFFSKTNHLRTLLSMTWLSLYVPFYNLHAIHTFAGKVVAYAVLIHVVTHCVRWGLQGRLHLLVDSETGVSGLISAVLTPLIVLPFAVPFLKKRLSWEWRKGLHYLAVPWGIAICFHAPETYIFTLMGIPVLMYVLDYVLGSLLRTYHISEATFLVLETSVELTFRHPARFLSDGAGYVMVCVPWVSKNEWHAYSLFTHPTLPGHSSICIQVSGDWTRKLHGMVHRPIRRDAWISGPFASAYSTAVEYENLILVASGIGITPAISIIHSLQVSRRCNLVWVCRDASLLEFYLDKCSFGRHGWTLIYYTGKRKLRLRSNLGPTVLLLPGRPDLSRTVLELIHGVESGQALPEKLTGSQSLDSWMIGSVVGVDLDRQLESAVTGTPSQGAVVCPEVAISDKIAALVLRFLAAKGEAHLKKRTEEIAGQARRRAQPEAASPPVALREDLEEFFTPVVEEGSTAFAPSDESALWSIMTRADGTSRVAEVLQQAMRASIIDGDGETSKRPEGRRRSSFRAAKRSAPAHDEPTSDDLRALLEYKFRASADDSDQTGSCIEQQEAGALESSAAVDEELLEPSTVIRRVGAQRLAAWEMLYCGGSTPIVHALKGVQRDTGLMLRVEKFDW